MFFLHWQGQDARIASPDWRTSYPVPISHAISSPWTPSSCQKSPIHPFTPITTSRLVALLGAQSVGKLLQRAPDELGLLPQVGGEEAVGVGDGGEGGLEGVLEGLGGAGGGGVGILDTGELEKTLDGGGGDQGGTTGSGDKLRGADMSVHHSILLPLWP